jgi:hypothetical protein
LSLSDYLPQLRLGTTGQYNADEGVTTSLEVLKKLEAVDLG